MPPPDIVPNNPEEGLQTSDMPFSGIKVIDDQHLIIIEQLNKLKKLAITRNVEKLSEALFAITDYCLVHFKTEERLMSESSYPKSQDMLDAHCSFVSLMNKHLGSERISEPESLLELTELLEHWLICHIPMDIEFTNYYTQFQFYS